MVEKSRPTRRRRDGGWVGASWTAGKRVAHLCDYNVLQYDIMQHSCEYDRVLSSRSAQDFHIASNVVLRRNRPHNYEFTVKHRRTTVPWI